MINIFELFGKYTNMFVVGRRAVKMNNKLVGGNRRDVVKSVAKRLPCTCLKKLHRTMRMKVAKVGACFCCDKRFPRSQLRVCTGCMFVHYCSRECQRVDWTRHKEAEGCSIPK